MIHSLAGLLNAFLLGYGFFFPSPYDKGGWALRVQNFSEPGPYLVGESISEVRTRITLFNSTQKVQTHASLADARVESRLKLEIVGPDGKLLDSVSLRLARGDPREPIRLQAGASSTFNFRLIAFGYWMVRPTGKHSVQATLKIDGILLKSPPIAFEVIELSDKAILTSHKVELEGYAAAPPEVERVRPFIQQVQIQNRTFIFYSHYNSAASRGAIQHAHRLTELPGKVFDLKVEGAFGDGNPLTITYREHSYTKFTTKHVINSVDGRPWTAEEEKRRQERLKKLAPVPEKK